MRNNVLDYGMTLLMLLTSGSVFYFIFISPSIAYLLFLLASYVYFRIKKCKLKIVGSSWYIVIFILLILTNRLFLNPNIDNNRWLGLLVGALSSYFYYSSFSFNRHRKILLDVLSFITIPSICVFLLDLMGVIPLNIISNERGTFSMFYIFCIGNGGNFYRMASIWHEPGACQIFLNAVLLLYTPLVRKNMLTKGETRKIIIIVIGVLCTMSTTGYIALLIILYFMIKPRLKYLSFLPKITIMTLCLVGFTLMIGSDIVAGKFNSSADKTSFTARQSDNIACFLMAVEKPFSGYGIGTKEFYDKSFSLDNETSSNGLLQISAFMGIVWLFIYTFYVLKGMRIMNLGIPIFISVSIFYLLESNEAYVEYPISYLFVVKFRDYFSPVIIGIKSKV